MDSAGCSSTHLRADIAGICTKPCNRTRLIHDEQDLQGGSIITVNRCIYALAVYAGIACLRVTIIAVERVVDTAAVNHAEVDRTEVVVVTRFPRIHTRAVLTH